MITSKAINFFIGVCIKFTNLALRMVVIALLSIRLYIRVDKWRNLRFFKTRVDIAFSIKFLVNRQCWFTMYRLRKCIQFHYTLIQLIRSLSINNLRKSRLNLFLFFFDFFRFFQIFFSFYQTFNFLTCKVSFEGILHIIFNKFRFLELFLFI